MSYYSRNHETNYTNSCNLELYSVLGEYDNAGFPLTYCFLTTAQAIGTGKRKHALAAWGKVLRDRYSIIPRFSHTDKDMAEIGMLKEIWKHTKIQLCWWHMRKAVGERMAKAKLSTTPYNAKQAHSVFKFIDPQFKPSGRPDKEEYEGGKYANFEDSLFHAPEPSRLWASQTMIRLPPMKSCTTT